MPDPTPDLPAEGTGPRDSESRPRLDTIAAWREQGYTETFRVVAGGRIACASCADERDPEELRVDHTGRYEGVSDPGDEQLLLALSCGPCGRRGTLTMAYGPTASADEAEAARRLPDARPR